MIGSVVRLSSPAPKLGGYVGIQSGVGHFHYFRLGKDEYAIALDCHVRKVPFDTRDAPAVTASEAGWDE